MDISLFLMCKFEFRTILIKFNSSGEFCDLVDKLCESFELTRDKVTISYSLPGHSCVLLRNQADLNLMFEFACMLGVHSIDMNIGVISSGVGSSGNNSHERVDILRSNSLDENVVLSIVSTSASESFSEGSSFEASNCSLMKSLDSNVSSSDEISTNNGRTLLSSSWATEIRDVGQIFCGVNEFRNSLRRFSTELGFDFLYVKNNRDVVIAVCALKEEFGCIWSIRGSVSEVDGSFRINEFVKEHTCGVLVGVGKSTKLRSNELSTFLVDSIRNNNSWTACDAMRFLNDSYGLSVPYKKAWRSLEKAKESIFGSQKESYSKLRWYVDAATRTNPGSKLVLNVREKRFFQFFVAFNASILGFKYCRPLLFLDGTHLKGVFKGVLLTAIAKDGNTGLFPVALGVADAENEENWFWFLSELSKIVGNERKLVFVSDRHHGLLNSIPQLFPHSSHFFCLEHLKNNLRDHVRNTRFSDTSKEQLVTMLNDCANALTIPLFTQKLNEFRSKGGAAVDNFLKFLPFEKWTNAHGKHCRYGEMTSNAAESFNSWVLKPRTLPVLNMVDDIRIDLMTWFEERRSSACKWTTFLCPKMDTKLKTAAAEGRTWRVRACSVDMFEVFSDPSFMVNIKERVCTCRKWQVEGFPCAHALCAIGRSRKKLEDFVDCYFYKSYYLKAYEALIYPIPTSSMSEYEVQPGDEILPPLCKRPPGRPRKKRFRSRGEVVGFVRCGRCGKVGHHNKKTCKEPITK